MKEIKKRAELLKSGLKGVFSQNVTVLSLLLNFLGIIFLRSFEEKFLAFSSSSVREIQIEFMHNFFFFSLTFFLIWLILNFFLQKKPSENMHLLLWGFFLILAPPLLDMFKTGGNIFWSFYLLDDLHNLGWQFLTVFGRLPSGIVYFGTKITFLLTIALVAGIVYQKTKHWGKMIGSALASYGALFFMGSFPSWFVFSANFFSEKDILSIKSIEIAQFFGAPQRIFGLEVMNMKYAFPFQLGLVFFLGFVSLAAIVFWLEDRNKFWAVAKNARFPQLFYHGGLLLAGMGIGFWLYPHSLEINLFSGLSFLVIGASIVLAWLASVVFNDIYDYEIDLVSNSHRPLQKQVFSLQEYWQLGIILFIFSVLGGMTISLMYGGIFLAYQLLAWSYSAPPYRLKKFPLIATFFSSLASVLILFSGFLLFSGEEQLKLFPWRIGFLFILGLTLSLPIKDFRDKEGDEKEGVMTVPVLFGHKWGRIIVGAGIFVSFVSSTFFLNEKRLFWWAVLFGGTAFWILNAPCWQKKISKHHLTAWMLALVFLYALILVKIVFIEG